MRKLFFQFHWRCREWQERRAIKVAQRNGKAMVAVYTMGKVGSTSVYYALKTILKGNVVFVHRLKKQTIEQYDNIFLKMGSKPHRSFLASYFYKHWISAEQPTKVYTAFRDPVARNISDFFQDFKVFNNGKSHEEISVALAIENFKKNYDCKLPAQWFKNDFLPSMGLTIDAFNFDSAQGYGLTNRGPFQILAVRTDLDDASKVELISNLLGFPISELSTKNANHQKGYAVFYSSFLEQIKFEPERLNEIYNQAYVRKVFSEAEVAEMKARWSILSE